MRSAPATSPSSACTRIRWQQASSWVGSRLTIAVAIFVLDVGGDILRDQTGAEASHQPVMDGLTFRQNPDPKRRIEIVHAFENPLVEIRGIEQQRMHAAALRLPDDAFDIDIDLLGVEMDREPLRDEPAISRILERGAQFANDLAQRGAGFFLVRTAPQQADQPFAAFVLGLRQGEVAENGAGLLGPQFDPPAVELSEAVPPARPKDARRSRASSRPRSASQPLNAATCCIRRFPYRFASFGNYIRAMPPV